MPELTAGSTILAQDTPPTVIAEDTTDIENISSTSYIPGTPAVGTTFVAATTGRAEINLFGRLEQDSANRIWLSYEVYLGTDATGTLVTAGSDNNAVSINQNTSDEGKGMTNLQTGLTPGSTYFIRTVHRVGGGALGTLRYRRVMVAPAT